MDEREGALTAAGHLTALNSTLNFIRLGKRDYPMLWLINPNKRSRPVRSVADVTKIFVFLRLMSHINEDKGAHQVFAIAEVLVDHNLPFFSLASRNFSITVSG